jgi:hypothetical protein
MEKDARDKKVHQILRSTGFKESKEQTTNSKGKKTRRPKKKEVKLYTYSPI